MRALVFAVLSSVMLGCGGSSVSDPIDRGPRTSRTALGQPFDLALGAETSIDGTQLRVRFADLLEDSRCPATAICIWAGNGAILLELRGTSTARPRLNTMLEPRSASHEGYRITLLELQPYPGTTPKPAEKKDYVARIVVEETRK